MKKKLNIVLMILVVMSTLLILSSIAVSPVSADPLKPNINNAGYKHPTNPYSDLTQCTAFVWGRTFEKYGIKMPKYGNAVDWYAKTKYTESSVPRADSIAVWKGGSYGHVAYVEKVEGGYVYINEANYNTYKKGGGYDNNYKKLTTNAMKLRSDGKYKLKGYIYLPVSSSPTLVRVVGTNPVYHIDTNGKKAWIPTANVFNSWGWSWSDIKDVSKGQFDSYPTASPSKIVFRDGTFIKYNNEISIIQNGQRCAFANWQAYLNHGGDPALKNVYSVNAYEYSLNAPGTTYYS